MDQITVAKEVICQINIFEDVLNDATKSNGNYKGWTKLMGNLDLCIFIHSHTCVFALNIRIWQNVGC